MSASAPKKTPVKRTYSKKDRQRPFLPVLTPPLSSQPSQPPQVAPVQKFPVHDPAIRRIAAGKANLDEDQWQLVVDSQRDEYYPPLDSDDEEELRDIFDVRQDQDDVDILDVSHVMQATPANAPPVLVLERSDLDKVKQQWAQIYNDGLDHLARAVMQEEIDARLTAKKGLSNSDIAWTAHVMHDILISTPRILLESVMLGSLSLDKRNNPQLEAILKQTWDQSANQASIYHQMLVDSDGKSPTPSQLRVALRIMLRYIKGCDKPETKGINATKLSDAACHSIDTFKGYRRKPLNMRRVQNGHRKYMFHTVRQKAPKSKTTAATKKGKAAAPSSSGSDSDSDDSQPSKSKKKSAPGTQPKNTTREEYCAAHVIQTLAFIDALTDRLDKIPSNQQDQPLVYPLCEVGYSIRSITRLKSHKAHSSSNYIMSLLEAICATQVTVRCNAKIEQEVIYLIWKPDQAEVSEIGWTKLAEGYIHNGGGFSHYPAGLSNCTCLTRRTCERLAASQRETENETENSHNRFVAEHNDRHTWQNAKLKQNIHAPDFKLE